jgi:anti-sigma regulatory factor (Ser/Thr protein kinase)
MSLRRRLSSDPASARDAREIAKGFLRDEGLAGQSDLLLVVSELVTNAVLHGHGPVELMIRRTTDSIRVEVFDAEQALPTLLDPGPTDLHGRGLLLVDNVARSWGAEPIPDDGKHVWCEVDIT